MDEVKKNESARQAPTREMVQEFTQDGITIQVEQTLGLKPRFSLKIGKKLENGWLAPFVPVFIEGLGSVRIRSLLPVMAKLLADAEAWISATAQAHEDKNMEFRLAKEQRDASFGKPKTRHTGKTEKKREKLRQAKV